MSQLILLQPNHLIVFSYIKGGMLWQHPCICRLTLASICASICARLPQATKNANSSLTVFLTADRCWLRTVNSSCLSSSLPLHSISRWLVSSAVRCQLPLCISLRQLPLWLLSDLYFQLHFQSSWRSRVQSVFLVSRQNRQRDCSITSLTKVSKWGSQY